jgi:hypothetical protein
VAGLRDDERDRLLQTVGVGCADHHGLRHAVVGEQPVLHLGRCYPHAADLEYVGGPPEARVVPVAVPDIGVAGAQPFALEHLA